MTVSNVYSEMFESYVTEAEAEPFSGWDFSFVTRTGRMIEAPLSWNYHNAARFLATTSRALLDMGTGGGEVLSTFAPLPAVSVATEQYKPNVAIARARLEPLGVRVIEIEEEKAPPYNRSLPFDDGYFDLILNRHEAYYPPELMRIMRPGAVFVTQQVGNRNWRGLLRALLGDSLKASHWNLRSAVDELKASGFEIIRQEEDIQFCRFYDVGAIVYALRAVPWAVPDFSVEKYRDRLWKVHEAIVNNGYYDTDMHRFLAIARKGRK